MKKLLIPLLCLSLLSCKDDTEQTPLDDDKVVGESNAEATSENTAIEAVFDDLFGVAEKAKKDTESASTLRTGATTEWCANVSLTDTVITVDFGDGCTYNGISRKGKVEVHFSGRYQDEGTVIVTKPVDYEVKYLALDTNYIKVRGTETVTNQGVVDGKMTWGVSVVDGEIEYVDGDISLWASERTRVLEEAGSILPFDEEYSIYGSAEGTTREGVNYDMQIDDQDPIYFSWACWFTARMPIAGTVTFEEEGQLPFSVDYGHQKDQSEDCDRSVLVTYAGFSIEIEL